MQWPRVLMSYESRGQEATKSRVYVLSAPPEPLPPSRSIHEQCGIITCKLKMYFNVNNKIIICIAILICRLFTHARIHGNK